MYNWLHKWAGKLYILGMIWTIATSSLIRNEGLPLGTLISFLWVLGGLTFGYILINIDCYAKWSKITHGSFMITSWMGIVGRAFNYDTHKNFSCYTYPFYKPDYISSNINNMSIMSHESSGVYVMVPGLDKNYEMLLWANKEVWGWGLPLAIGPFLGSLFFLGFLHH